MLELTDRDFHALCADERVRRIVEEANRSGRRAAFGFWGILIAGLAMVGAITAYAITSGWVVTGVIFGSVGVLVAYILAAIPLAMAGRAIKLPVYEILGARHGMDYGALVAAPSAFAEARPALFGAEPATESLTDFFHGKLLDGSDFAICQAYLHFDNGGSFNGRLFILGRTAAGDAVVDASHPGLKDVCRRGKLRLHAGPTHIIAALAGRKGFTPGLGFRFVRGEQRIRWMFDDLAESLATLRRLQAALDRGL